MDLKPYNKQEFNKLCAEFLGWVLEDGYYNRDMHHDYSFVKEDELKFHSDWNWINEIKEKIRLLGWRFDVSHSGSVSKSNNIVVFIWEKYCGGGDRTIVELEEMSEKEAVVKAIWEFINWYIEQE